MLTAAVVVSGLSPDGLAQKFPTKPMRMVSAFAPGGGTDILARAIATPVSESFGQPIVVDNRPGAGGTMGSDFVARAAPDGYTISMVAILPHIKAGRLRALAITTPARSSAMPELPAIGETVPGFEVTHWYGIWGPKGMPKPIVARWTRRLRRFSAPTR